MKILLLAPHCPIPADMGIKTHLGFVLRTLAAAHTVEVLAFAASPREEHHWRQLAAEWRFRLLAVIPLRTGWGLAWERLRAVLSGEPVGVAHYRGPRVTEVLRQVSRPDWVIFDYYPTLVPELLAGDAPTLLLPVDCYSLYYARLARTAPRWWERMKARWLAARFAKWEARVYPQLTAVAPVGRVDAAELQRLAPEARVRVLPVAVETADYAEHQRLRVLVCGAYWMPAVAADALELLQHWQAAGELVVWGRGAPAELREAVRQAGGEYVEWVEDYDRFLASGAIYVYPQRAAAGLQTKVQQAMAAGLAVVAVPEILEALEVTGQEAVAVEAGEPMARAVQRLAADPAARAALGEAARAHVAARFAPERVSATLQQILEEAHV